jgi:hypothetical protein
MGIFGSLGLTLLGFVAQKYVVPFLKVGRRQKYAQYIAAIADEAIDELRIKYPEKTWLKHLDEAVDVVVEITGISHEISLRAVRAAAARR